MNKFETGQTVVCVKDDFPMIKKHSSEGSVEAIRKPRLKEHIAIDEILGDFLRFSKYDTEDSWNWWHYSRFKSVVHNRQFEIYGQKRRELKRELSQIKSLSKNFWFYHNMDKDMTSIYGGADGFPMSDEAATMKYNGFLKEIEVMEVKLAKPYLQTQTYHG